MHFRRVQQPRLQRSDTIRRRRRTGCSGLLEKRRELHARVAQVIETLFVDRLEEFYGLLAYHYSKAELWEKAQAYLLRAGDQAGRIAVAATGGILFFAPNSDGQVEPASELRGRSPMNPAGIFIH